MKKKIVGAAAMASGIYMGFGWSFFNLTVRCKKNRKESKKKWFQLHHTKINHPRYEHEEEYEEGKAWCRQQKMQDCFIRSRDGLKLHGYYLPAKDAKRFVLLCHGYKGSGFGDFAGYSCAAEPPVQYRLSHLSRRSEPLIKHTICMMRVYSRNALSNPYTSRMEISCSASMLVMLMR